MKRLSTTTKNSLRQVRHTRVRANLVGTSTKPRLSVFRGLKNIVAQLIDDSTGKTLIYVSSAKLKVAASKEQTKKVAAGFAVGEALAKAATAKGITAAVFDRGGYKYHGRVAAVAEGARAGGLKF
jgi:large subunit ribosomal protein L18